MVAYIHNTVLFPTAYLSQGLFLLSFLFLVVGWFELRDFRELFLVMEIDPVTVLRNCTAFTGPII